MADTDYEWGAHPISAMHQSRDWHEHGQASVGASSSQVPVRPFASAGSSSSLSSQRRRSAAVNVPPAPPPPTQPIPSVPELVRTRSEEDGLSESADGDYYAHMSYGGYSAVANALGRPNVSARLATVAMFSQAAQKRHPSASNGRSMQHPDHASPPPHIENLSDPPPRSILTNAGSRSQPEQHREIVPDRLMLSPPQPRPTENRPSSRRALTRALELAREAVQLDATNDDPHAAVVAYGRSVALLSEVMERVRRGEDSTESRRRNGRRRSAVAQEEEVRRLKSIHDTYADRMNILSVIYSIPPVPQSPTALYASAVSPSSTESTTPSSPTSPSSNESSTDRSPQTATYRTEFPYSDSRDSRDEATAAIGIAMFDIDSASSTGSVPGSTFNRTPSPAQAPSYHPYAAAQRHETEGQPALAPPTLSARSRSSSFVGRARSSSALPPPAPPPLNSLPPAPISVNRDNAEQVTANGTRHLEVTNGRPRGNSSSHARAGSDEDNEATLRRRDAPQLNLQDSILRQDLGAEFEPDTPRTAKRSSHPLPPLPSIPSPPATQPATRSQTASQPQPNGFVPPKRGPSLVARSEGSTPPPQPQYPNLINSSTQMGTIHQRRTTSKTSPPSGSPPNDYALPTGPSRLTGSSMPPSTAASLGMGRNRASSQPGRRPSLVGGRVSPMDNRPPMPQTAGLPGMSGVPRKASFPSKLNPNNQSLPQLIIQTEISPTGFMPPGALVPPPAIPVGGLITTPTSPLPPLAPTDTLRKPYHMMMLLRNTMTQRSGGYLTRRLHVPQEVWSQGGAKLTNTPEKARVLEVLCSALDEIATFSAEHFGAGNVSIGMGMGIGSIGKKEADAWVAKLEDFSAVCDGVVANFGKKLGVGEGFVLKKNTGVIAWGDKLSSRLSKLTNNKNLDSPTAYVSGLQRLFASAQLLDEHNKALCSVPVAPIYAAFPADARNAAELKLKRASEFFASVVLTFVIRDLSQLLDKYVKKCEKWLAE